MGTRKIKLLLCDDHPMIKQGLKSLLESSDNMEYCFEIIRDSCCSENIPEICIKENPDLLLLDMAMPRLSGLDILIEMKNLGIKTKAVFYSAFDDELIVKKVFTLGAYGFIKKTSSEYELPEILISIYNGDKYFPQLEDVEYPKDYETVFSGFETSSIRRLLNEKELEVFVLCGNPLPICELQETINKSRKSVELYLLNIKRKLDFKNQAELIRAAKNFILCE